MPLIEYELHQCHHALRHVRSDAIVPDRCDHWARGRPDEVLCDGSDTDSDMELDDTIFATRNDAGELGDVWPNVGLRSSTPIPALLHTSQEARSVASKSYTLSFATLGSKAQTYINFELDTLYLSLDGLFHGESFPGESFHLIDILMLNIIGALEYFCSEDRLKIKNLALDAKLMIHRSERDSGHDSDWLCCVLSLFGNVEKVTIVMQEYKGNLSKERTSAYRRSADQIFLEPVNIDRRHYMLERPDYHLKHENDHLPGMVLFEKVDDTDFAVTREFKIKYGASAWPKPVLEHKILTTSGVKANLEDLQQQYESTPGCCRCYEDEIVWYHDLYDSD